MRAKNARRMSACVVFRVAAAHLLVSPKGTIACLVKYAHFGCIPLNLSMCPIICEMQVVSPTKEGKNLCMRHCIFAVFRYWQMIWALSNENFGGHSSGRAS